MDDMILLIILREFAKSNQRPDPSFLKALLSNMKGEKLDETSFRNIASKLIERGYASKANGSYSITTEGSTIASALQTHILKEDDLRLVSNLVQSFLATPSEKREELTRELAETVEDRMLYAGARLQKIDARNLIANCLAGKFEFTIEGLYVTRVGSNIFADVSDPYDRFRILGKLEHQIEENVGTWCVARFISNSVEVVSPVPVTSSQGFPYSLEISPSQLKPLSDINALDSLVKSLIHKILRRRLQDLGYFSSGRGFSFYDYDSLLKERSRIGVIRYYEGFKIAIDIERADPKFRVLVWIDPIHKMTYTIFDYMEYLSSKGLNEKEIESSVKRIGTVRVIPYDSPGSIDSIASFSVDVHDEKVPGLDGTYFEFWKARHSIELKERSQSLISVKLGNNPYSYPSEALYIDRRDLKDEVGAAEELKPKTLTPAERIGRLTPFIIDAFESDITEEGCKLSIQPQLLSWESLVALGYCSAAWQISPPFLEFNHEKQHNDQSSDPRALFNYGPHSGPKKIHAVSLLIPQYLTDADVDSFKVELTAAFRRHNFGTLSFEETRTVRISEEIENQKLKRIIDSLPSANQALDELSIVILTFRQRELYLMVKKIMLDSHGIPAQIIMEDTFPRILEGEYGVTKNVALQIYTKFLKRSEAVWVLREPCDGNGTTLFVGVGFSANPTTGKKANSFAALCDARGRELEWDPLGVPFSPDKYIERNWFEGFLQYLDDKLRTRSSIKRVVVYRRGDTYETEIDTMISVLQARKTTNPFEFDLISVTEDVRRIFQRGQDWSNPQFGTLLQLSDDSILFAISSQREGRSGQGTVGLVRLKRVVGSSDCLSIAKEYHDIAFLNWTAPITISKYPFVLNLANKIADMMKDLRDEKIFRFFPS